MNKEMLDKLYEPFELKTRPGGGGMQFKYIPSEDVAHRLNQVFGGSWSTRVRSEHTIEDSVVLRVEVSAYDPEMKDWVSHEGFGASAFKRFTQGNKANQIIDPGNAYKAAMSMAIRDAAKRFGCGLYAEDGPVDNTNKGSFTPPAKPSMTPSNAPVAQPVVVQPIPPTPQAPPTPPSPPVTPQPVVQQPQQFVPPLDQPILDALPATPPATPAIPATPPTAPVTQAPPATPQQPVQPVVQSQVPTSQPEPVFNGAGEDIVSDVQIAALGGLVNIKGLDYVALVSETLGIPADQVPPMEQLTGKQATLCIQNGNNKTRR